MYERILVPTDMSEFGNLALRYAAAFRERIGSALTLLYADEFHVPGDLLEAPLGYYLEQAPESRQKLQIRLREYGAAQIGGGFETMVVQESPIRAIHNATKQIRPDLIIMGTHGRRGLRRAVLGSVTESLLHETETPVLTVTPALMAAGQEIAIRRILCPVNFTYVARDSLAHACEIAATFGADLHVMYVIEDLDRNRIREVESAFHHWCEPQISDRCSFTHSIVRDGDPAAGVLAAAGETTSDLIVIGAQHRFFSDATVLGTTTQRITRFARIPVLTVVRKARTEITLPDHELAGVM